MNAHIDQLQCNSDDLEQYQRRLCLRINGIPAPESGKRETAEESLEKVKEVFEELGIDIPDVVIDKAHRLGNMTEIDGKSYEQMIVRFTNRRQRTLVYRAWKKSKSHSIKLDLTAARAPILKNANNNLLPSRKYSFVFAGINCRLCAKLGSKFFYFANERELYLHLTELRSNARLESNQQETKDPNESGVVEFEIY